MRYLSRHKIYEKLEAEKNAKKVYIFCEGEVKEVNYFKFFQGFSSNIDILPIPSENGKSAPNKLKENADLLFLGSKTVAPKFDLSPDYEDEVWFVIDTDDWNQGNKIEDLKKYCLSKNEKYQGWNVAQSNPCFELWLYYHFNDIKPEEKDVITFPSFKDFVNTKVKGGFDNRSMPIEIQNAIANSEINFEIEKNQPKLFSTEVHLLGKVILPFVKEKLDKCLKQLE